MNVFFAFKLYKIWVIYIIYLFYSIWFYYFYSSFFKFFFYEKQGHSVPHQILPQLSGTASLFLKLSLAIIPQAANKLQGKTL